MAHDRVALISGANRGIGAALAAELARQGWRLELEGGENVSCAVLVNAAGAWADQVAKLAAVRQLGINPLRRTVVQLRTKPVPPIDLPLVLGIDEKLTIALIFGFVAKEIVIGALVVIYGLEGNALTEHIGHSMSWVHCPATRAPQHAEWHQHADSHTGT